MRASQDRSTAQLGQRACCSTQQLAGVFASDWFKVLAPVCAQFAQGAQPVINKAQPQAAPTPDMARSPYPDGIQEALTLRADDSPQARPWHSLFGGRVSNLLALPMSWILLTFFLDAGTASLLLEQHFISRACGPLRLLPRACRTGDMQACTAVGRDENSRLKVLLACVATPAPVELSYLLPSGTMSLHMLCLTAHRLKSGVTYCGTPLDGNSGCRLPGVRPA